jgi:protein-disulfide isomerase
MTEKMESSEEIKEPIQEPGDSAGDVSPRGEVTITLRRVHLYAIVMPLIFIIGLGLGFLLRDWIPMQNTAQVNASQAPTTGETDPVAAQTNPQAPSATQQVVRYEIPVDDDPMQGSADAPITIVEFSDFECPYCRSWHTDVYPRLMDEYGDQIRFVYRDFPLESIHVNAKPAAEAANCANEQGVYWEYHEKLFSMELGLSSEAYQDYASQLDMDVDAFQECLDSDRYVEEVQSDFDFAANLGVRSTPTFFINGIAVVGAQPYEVFQQVIEKELAGEIP